LYKISVNGIHVQTIENYEVRSKWC